MEASALPININSLGDLETVFNRLMVGEDIRIENIKLNFSIALISKSMAMKTNTMVHCHQVLLRVSVSFRQKCIKFIL